VGTGYQTSHVIPDPFRVRPRTNGVTSLLGTAEVLVKYMQPPWSSVCSARKLALGLHKGQIKLSPPQNMECGLLSRWFSGLDHGVLKASWCLRLKCSIGRIIEAWPPSSYRQTLSVKQLKAAFSFRLLSLQGMACFTLGERKSMCNIIYKNKECVVSYTSWKKPGAKWWWTKMSKIRPPCV